MFEICFWDAENLWTRVGSVCGCEAAYTAFETACDLAEMLGKDCALMDGETGEVLALMEIES